MHPDYLLATLDNDTYARYTRLRNAREAKAYRYQQGVISGKHTLIQVKDAPPYTEEQQPQVRDSILRERQNNSKTPFFFLFLSAIISFRGRRNEIICQDRPVGNTLQTKWSAEITDAKKTAVFFLVSSSSWLQVYLDPTARASYDPVVGSWTFGGATRASF